MVCLNKRGRPSAPTSSSSIVARPLSSSSIQPSSNSDNLNWQLVTATDLDDMLAQIRAMSREDEDGSGRSENNVG